MKRIISFFLVSAALLCATAAVSSAQDHDWAGFGRYVKANADVKKAPRAVFYGDSITDGWGRHHDDFFKSNKCVARGISGQTTSEMLVRMRQDVISLHPKYMILLAGINDIARNNGAISVENAIGNIISMCELCKANKIKPILCALFPVNAIPWRSEVEDTAEQVAKFNGMLRAYASANKIQFVDYFPLECYIGGRLDPKYSGDGIHPTPDGYEYMQQVIVNYL